MAAGKVTTGFSKPYVAVYAVSGSTVTYSSGTLLGRGREITITAESTDDNIFYADNVAAENDGGRFTGGTVSITIDGLLAETRRLIYGLPATTGGWTDYGDNMVIPYVGIGGIIRRMSDGVTTYVPVVLTKCRFNISEDAASTQEESIDWQTEELEASIFRDDSSNHVWKKIGDDQTTEAAAEGVIKTLFGIS